MFKFHNTTEKSADMFQLLKRMQNHLVDFKTLEIFALPKPVCLQNEYSINMFHLSNKWLGDFPDLKVIKKFIKDEKKLFYVPEEDYYYLYYHLLLACKEFLKLGNKKIYDDETRLDYDKISDYLIRKNLNATKFFEVYLEKGENLNSDDLVHATLEEVDEVTDYKFDEKFIPRRMMSSEPIEIKEKADEVAKFDFNVESTLPQPIEILSESEIEIPKTVSPSPSPQFEIEVENYFEGKKVYDEEQY